jgi:hypothetical protein
MSMISWTTNDSGICAERICGKDFRTFQADAINRYKAEFITFAAIFDAYAGMGALEEGTSSVA